MFTLHLQRTHRYLLSLPNGNAPHSCFCSLQPLHFFLYTFKHTTCLCSSNLNFNFNLNPNHNHNLNLNLNFNINLNLNLNLNICLPNLNLCPTEKPQEAEN